MAFYNTKQLVQQKVAWNKPPDGQAVTIAVALDFSVQTTWTLDLAASEATRNAQNIQSAFIDNHLNPNAIVMTVNSTGQLLPVAGAASNWVQLLMASPNTFTFFSAGTTTAKVTVYLCNFPVTANTDQLLSSVITNGHIQVVTPSGTPLQVADAILDGTVSGGKVSVSDSALEALISGGNLATVISGVTTANTVRQVHISNLLANTVLTASGASAAIVTGATGYYITGITLQLSPISTQSAAGSFEVTISDSSSGTMAKAEFYVPSTVTAPTIGSSGARWDWQGFWNNKTNNSTLNITLPAALTAGGLTVTVNYGISNYVG